MSELRKFKVGTSFSRVDKENGILRGVNIITGNREASGHEMYVDETTVEQVVAMGMQTGNVGLKARFDHPNACSGSMGTVIGRFKNFRKEGIQAKADLHLLESAAKSPNGNYRDYILSLAEEAPDSFATSIVFRADESFIPEESEFKEVDPQDPFFLPHVRIASLTHCDVVDEGAANDSFFSPVFGRPNYWKEQVEFFVNENPEILENILDTYFNSKKMEKEIETFEDAAKENEEVILSEQESDLVALQKEVSGLTELTEELTKQNEELSAKEKAFNELTEEHNKLQEQFTELESLKLDLESKIKELSEIQIGEPLKEGSSKSVEEVKQEKKQLSKEEKRQEKLSQIMEWRNEQINK